MPKKAVLICPHQLQFYQNGSFSINSSLIYPPHDTADENINVKLKTGRTMALSLLPFGYCGYIVGIRNISSGSHGYIVRIAAELIERWLRVADYGI